MMQYPNSLKVLDQDFAGAPETDLTKLAHDIVEDAKIYDMARLDNLTLDGRLASVARDRNNPPEVTHDSILGAPWADKQDDPLQQGELWNEGRRATNTGLTYTFNEKGRPINPYMNTGLQGRGVLGAFGPNHAVDNGPIVVKDDETGNPTLYVLGIEVKAPGNPPAFAGGFAKYEKNADGKFVFDRAAMVESQMEEFFEEMISGSITLLPDYAEKFPVELQAEIDHRVAERHGLALSDHQLEEISSQVETALKLEQVRDLDPGFIERLYDVIDNGHECFSGPVLNGHRNTNNAWIESILTWFVVDDKVWQDIKGDHPVFDYQFAAGDDAGAVKFHKLEPDLIERSCNIHGAMFAFLTASYLLDTQKQGKILPPSIRAQAEDIATFLNRQKSLNPG